MRIFHKTWQQTKSAFIYIKQKNIKVIYTSFLLKQFPSFYKLLSRTKLIVFLRARIQFLKALHVSILDLLNCLHLFERDNF